MTAMGVPVNLASSPLNLTQHEIEAMKTRHNLAAAHCRQRAHHAIVNRLPQLWHQAEHRQQHHFEARFLRSFFELHGQPTALEINRTMLSYSASVCTMVAATYLMQHNKSVALIEPCVDNLADILGNMRLRLEAIDETALAAPERIYQELTGRVRSDALFLVDPNNPTGSTLLESGRSGFEQVVRFCADRGKILILDLCFASFALADARFGRFDIYELLEESGVTYMAIEDTGKTWPVRDAKCAMLTVSQDIWDDLYDIHTSVLLSVSPFVLNLLTEQIRHSIDDQFASLREVIEHNRECVLKALDGSMLSYQEPAANVSVAWLRIEDETVTASRLQRALVDAEIYVLPGTYFYWSNPLRGERFLRIALARDPQMFAVAMARLRAALDAFIGSGPALPEI